MTYLNAAQFFNCYYSVIVIVVTVFVCTCCIANLLFSYSATQPHVDPKVWNTLPLNIRQTSDTQTFKRKLKTFLFCTSYNIPTPTLSPQTDILCSSLIVFVCIVFYCILAYFIIYFTA